jgi:hypothetical protein
MLSAGFEPAIPVAEWPQTYGLNRTITRTGWLLAQVFKHFEPFPKKRSALCQNSMQ